MNNLKRVLSLALSTIMLVGMMAVGASAAPFTDADTIEHTDAVNTLVALNIVNGQDDGSFNPTGDVTRAQMAKMIAVAMNGGTDTNTGVKGTATFTDIKGHWAESYIEYCADLGIINGRGDGTFDPDGKVTTIEAAKMVLTALGYDAKAYELTGAKWATQTDQLSRKASPSLYEELPTGLVLNTNASRDTAAQLIWNGLQNKTVRIDPDESRSDGTITWGYSTTGNPTLLKERFDADIWIGTYMGNYNSLGTPLAKGDIRVYGRIENNDKTNFGNANFPSEMDISNIGEEVKVIFKDGKNGVAGRPDGKDNIFGVFNTGKTVVYNVTRNDMGDNATAGKVKFNDDSYDILATSEDPFVIVVNYGANSTIATGAGALTTTGSSYTTSAAATAALNALALQSGNKIKLIANEDGKIVKAYVTDSELAKVTSITSKKITLSGVGAIDIEGNDVYEDIKKDDVVVYTKLYDSDITKAHFIVEKAETVEGEITRYVDNNSWNSPSTIYIDGEKYSVAGEGWRANLTDDYITSHKDNVGTEVAAYMLNGMVGALNKLSDTEYHYALVISDNRTQTKGVNTGRVQLLLGDNSKMSFNVDEDSYYQPVNSPVATASGAHAEMKEADLVKYSVNSDGELKVASGDLVTAASKTLEVWNADTKIVKDGTNSGVAAADCVMFAKTGANTYKAYNVRNLRTLSVSAKNVSTMKNASTGQIKAAYVEYGSPLPGGTTNVTYGMVVAQNGVEKINGDYYASFDMWTGEGDEPVKVYIEGQLTRALSKGVMYKYDATTDGKYAAASEFTPVGVGSVGGGVSAKNVAVKEYNEKDKIISFYTGVTFDGHTYTGANVDTLAVDSNLKVIYVNMKTNKLGDAIGINEFNTGNGFANAKLVIEDGVVIAIFVETSGEKNIDGTTTVVSSVVTPTGTPATDLANVKAELTNNKSVTVNGDVSLGDFGAELDEGCSLRVVGDLTLTANVSFKGMLEVTGDITATGVNITVNDADASLIAGDVACADLSVTGTAGLGDVAPTGNLTVAGTATMDKLTVAVSTTNAVTGTLTVGEAALGADVTGTGKMVIGTFTDGATSSAHVKTKTIEITEAAVAATLEAIPCAAGQTLIIGKDSTDAATVTTVGATLKFWATAGKSNESNGTASLTETTNFIKAGTYVNGTAYHGTNGDTSAANVWVIK